MYIGIIRDRVSNEILSHNIFPKGTSEDFVKTKVNEYNNSNYKTRYADYTFARDDSLVAYLAKKASEPILFTNETVTEALEAIRTAENAICSLRYNRE